MISVEAFVWMIASLAGLGALASLVFYRRAGRPLSPEVSARLSAHTPEVRRLASRLSSRPTWLYDVGMVSGGTLFATALLVPGDHSPYAGVGAFLLLISLTGRLLVLAGRRRLRRIEESLG